MPPMNKKKQGKVCRDCHRVVDGENCVICGNSTLKRRLVGRTRSLLTRKFRCGKTDEHQLVPDAMR